MAKIKPNRGSDDDGESGRHTYPIHYIVTNDKQRLRRLEHNLKQFMTLSAEELENTLTGIEETFDLISKDVESLFNKQDHAEAKMHRIQQQCLID